MRLSEFIIILGGFVLILWAEEIAHTKDGVGAVQIDPFQTENINTTENFPDPNFRAVVEKFMGIDSGVSFTAEQAAAKTGRLSCYGKNIQDMTGLQYLKKITALDCRSNQLSKLDVSANTALTDLWCHYNQLSELDVSANTALTELSCGSNQLSELDVSANTALTELDCDNNQLSELDVSTNTAMTVLWCWNNKLSELDVSANTALTYLSCWNNQLSELDVSANTALTVLDCWGNQLSELDISANTALTYLHCSYNQLSELDVSANTALTFLECYSNQLSVLDVSGCTALTDLICSYNQLSDIKTLVTNSGLKAGDCVDVRWNNLGTDDEADIVILRDRIGEPVFSGFWLLSGFAYSPQNDPSTEIGDWMNY